MHYCNKCGYLLVICKANTAIYKCTNCLNHIPIPKNTIIYSWTKPQVNLNGSKFKSSS